jgi:hypothetical protein
MLACLHNPSKQASKQSPVLEGRAGAEHKKKKTHFIPKVSVWHKTITVASRTRRIFFLKNRM